MPAEDTWFPPGNRPWNAGSAGAGLCRPNRGSFGRGRRGGSPILPLGSLRWNGQTHEVEVKTSMKPRYPSESAGTGAWTPRRILNFEAAHGPVPRGCAVMRLLPLCECEPNLVLVTRAVLQVLNVGHWCRPARPWRSLPLDADLRLSAVMTAVVKVAAGRRARG